MPSCQQLTLSWSPWLIWFGRGFIRSLLWAFRWKRILVNIGRLLYQVYRGHQDGKTHSKTHSLSDREVSVEHHLHSFWFTIFHHYVNGLQFTSSKIIKFCEKKRISLKFGSMSYPWLNGRAGVWTKSNLNILKKKLVGRQSLWPGISKIPSIACKTCYFLVFGTKTLIQVDIYQQTARVKDWRVIQVKDLDHWRSQNGQNICRLPWLKERF